MHKSIIADRGFLYYQLQGGKGCLSNGHWLLSLDEYPLSRADLGFQLINYTLPESETNRFKIDLETNDVTEGPDCAQRFESDSDLAYCVKLDTGTPIALFHDTHKDAKRDFSNPIACWNEKASSGKYRAIDLSALGLKVEDSSIKGTIGIDPAYFAVAVHVLGCELYVEAYKNEMSADGAIRLVKDGKVIGVVMPMRI